MFRDINLQLSDDSIGLTKGLYILTARQRQYTRRRTSKCRAGCEPLIEAVGRGELDDMAINAFASQEDCSWKVAETQS